MKKEKEAIKPEDLEFSRTGSAIKGDHHITFTCQPYCVGLYTAIKDNKVSQLIQLSFQYKGDTIDKFIKNLKKEGFKIILDKQKVIDYLSKEDIETYILK